MNAVNSVESRVTHVESSSNIWAADSPSGVEDQTYIEELCRLFWLSDSTPVTAFLHQKMRMVKKNEGNQKYIQGKVEKGEYEKVVCD